MKKKYLMINASEMKKKVFDLYREPTIDGFDNWYIIKEMKNVKGYFDKKEIPEEFQKIILKLEKPGIIPLCNGKELFCEQEYKLLKTRRDGNSEKPIKGSALPKFHDNTMINRNLVFKTKKEYKDVTDVLEFIHDLEQSGYMQAYIEVMKEISDVEVSKVKYNKQQSEETHARKRTNK